MDLPPVMPSGGPPAAAVVRVPRDTAAHNLNEPMAGTLASVFLCLTATGLLSAFIALRFLRVRNWGRLPFVLWLVFAIYIDSMLFVYVTSMLHFGVGFTSNLGVCDGAILLCLVCYLTTKVMVYLFLVEKAHTVRNGRKSRLKSKLYCVNSFGMLSIYIAVAILNFVFRIVRLEDGQCIIGMERKAMLPLITFDLIVNVYLTMMFLLPLQKLYTFKDMQKTPANIRLRSMALRTFIGALGTTASSIINLSVLTAMDGEPAWVCLLCCNADILFSAIVLQWLTTADHAATQTSSNSACPHHHHSTGTGTATHPHTAKGIAVSVTARGGPGSSDDDDFAPAQKSRAARRASGRSSLELLDMHQPPAGPQDHGGVMKTVTVMVGRRGASDFKG